MTTETTYDEYRAAIAAQSQRDRDRFLGIDSHTEEPMYSADTGLSGSLPSWDRVAAMMQAGVDEIYDYVLTAPYQNLRLDDAQVNALAAAKRARGWW